MSKVNFTIATRLKLDPETKDYFIVDIEKQSRLFRIVWNMYHNPDIDQSKLNTHLQKTYRIDNRNFNCGDIIEAQNNYQKKLDSVRMFVVNILEKNRPVTKPKRNEILMLFENSEAARKHWIKQTNSKFYRTSISNYDILHIGDYNMVEELLKNFDRANEIAKEYWDSKMTPNPIIEIFVSSSIVEKIISNSEKERINTCSVMYTGNSLYNDNVRIITNEILEL